MKIGVPRETVPGENRVALVPDGATRLASQGVDIQVERGAGERASFVDSAYENAGCALVAGVLQDSDVVLKVQPPSESEAASMREGSALVGFLQPSSNVEVVQTLARRGVTAFSLELLPRISRAQSMDALSSQANIGGYKAVLVAAARLGKLFPMLMTAAGTIAPARVLVLGAGVAGLQAIATARRLGAVVEGYDVRAEVKEQIESLGAKFVELPLEAQQGGSTGGYAAEQSADAQARQRELLADHVATSDVVITTAAIPGRRAPVLVTSDMVARMRPGSVIVDLAADTGGNTELTRAGEEVVEGGVVIVGARNLPSTVPLHASQLYSRNVVTFLQQMLKDGSLQPDFDDEILKATCVTRGGEILHGPTRELAEAAAR